MDLTPTTGAGLIGIIGLAAYLFGRYISGRKDQKSEAEKELITLTSALKDRVDILEKSDREKDRINIQQMKDMGELSGTVRTLKEQLNQRDGLIIEALTHWFDSNPDRAIELGKSGLETLKLVTKK